MHNARPIPAFAALAITAALVSARPAEPVRAEDKARKENTKRAAAAASEAPVWPLPPDAPRIRYLATYRGASDFAKKKAPRWKALVFGEDDAPPAAPEDLVKPYGVTASADGRIYVTDTGARRVIVFDPRLRTATFLGDTGATKLAKPTGIAIDASGMVYVADATRNRIYGYAPDGRLTLALGGDGDLEAPGGMAIDQGRKLLYVADSKKHQVLCYSTADGSSVRKIGRRGSEPGEFNFPTNVFVDKEGRLYVTDTANFRIQTFDPEGNPIGEFGTLGDTPGSLNRPKGVAVDDEGHIYVADTSFNNFQIFDKAGQLLLDVGSAGAGPGEFFLPAGLFIDASNRVYVVDQGNARVQVFQYLRAPAK